MESNTTIFDRLNQTLKRSIGIKLFSVTVLVLLLLIPASMVFDLIEEREMYRSTAIREVSDKWGGSQTLSGPVLSVPYTKYHKDENGVTRTATYYAHFLPETLNIDGRVNPEKRYRGIYEIVLYNTKMKVSGTFSHPDFGDWNVPNENVQWENAFLSVGIPDMSGIAEAVTLQWDTARLDFEPGTPTDQVIGVGINTKIALDPVAGAKVHRFELQLNLKGSESLAFVPVGKRTEVKLSSSWADPSFNGPFLPYQREVSAEGFQAQWRVLDMNRNYPQKWRGNRHNIAEAAFGVDLLLPVDEYQKNMRSAKYSVLIISLTFLVFFAIEVLNKKRIHPFQYILVGLALTMFYALLLSITEHLGFDKAYGIAALAVVLLITGYASAIFKNGRLTLSLGAFLTLIYGFIFVILQLQDFSLLVGCLGLFVILATVMYLSRNIDWYTINRRPEPAKSVPDA